MPGVFRRNWFPLPRPKTSFSFYADNTTNLTGVAATSAAGIVEGDHPSYFLVGVEATTQVGIIIANRVMTLGGLQVVAQIPGDTWDINKFVYLIGVEAEASPTSQETQYPAGGGGGGAAGLSGDGEDGQDALQNGTGGYGGFGDNNTTPRQTTPGANGNDGTQFDGILGVGSGGAGGSWTTGVGQNGGDGGLYGGGGGGGGGGLMGAGLGGQGADGIVYIEYQGTSGLVKIVLDKNSSSPWVVPSDWSGTNRIILVGPGGCGENGSFFSGGDGGHGGDTVGVVNTLIFNPGDLIPFSIPATPCSEQPTTFSSYAAGAGANGGSAGGGTGAAGSAGFPGGFHYRGGLGGPKGRFSTLGIEPVPPIEGVEAVTDVGFFISTAPGPRDFIIGGLQQTTVAPGIVLLPTSEDINPVQEGTEKYGIGSSQFYGIAEVYWGSVKKTEGVDYEFVDPFRHIIHFLVPISLLTTVTFVYSSWDIGVRAGFQVNSYPVAFSFSGTKIIADRVPQMNQFFTVEYTSARRSDNPRSIFVRHPKIVDELTDNHTLYDGVDGFETYRPDGYTVFDTSDNQLWEWNSNAWSIAGIFLNNTYFYVKRDRRIYLYNAGTVTEQFVAGDPLNILFPEVIGYPLFGEGIGKNLLVDGFSPNAAIDYPEAYEVAIHPGDYDPWVGT